MAVLLDAVVVRGVVRPALLALMGRRTWPVPDAAPGPVHADRSDLAEVG